MEESNGIYNELLQDDRNSNTQHSKRRGTKQMQNMKKEKK